MNISMSNQKKSDQRGMVAIVVTLILMIIITLIVLAFAKLGRQEERNALDRQLSTQAFYAAESGVNKARSILAGWVSAADPKLDGSYNAQCDSFTSSAVANLTDSDLEISTAGNSTITCLLVDPTPANFQYTKTDSQIAFPFNPVHGGGGLDLYWDDGTSGNDFSGCLAPGDNEPTLPANCNASVIRVEITDNTLSTSKVFFIYPGTSASSPPPNWAGAGHPTGTRYQAACGAGGPYQKCSVRINGVQPGSYVRVTGIYSPIALTAAANTGSELAGGQAIIDVTGKAADVERRIQVRVPINGLPKDPPAFGLEAIGDVCKRFGLNGTTATDYGSCWTNSTTPN